MRLAGLFSQPMFMQPRWDQAINKAMNRGFNRPLAPFTFSQPVAQPQVPVLTTRNNPIGPVPIATNNPTGEAPQNPFSTPVAGPVLGTADGAIYPPANVGGDGASSASNTPTANRPVSGPIGFGGGIAPINWTNKFRRPTTNQGGLSRHNFRGTVAPLPSAITERFQY